MNKKQYRNLRHAYRYMRGFIGESQAIAWIGLWEHKTAKQVIALLGI